MTVELRKGQKVNLEKNTPLTGEILINLNWSKSGGSKAVDLDLGCLYELTDGRKSCVQALGNAFGDFDRPPYIVLDGDDRTGESDSGENLRVNGSKLPEIKKILVYTFIYEGAANWREADGIVTLKCPGTQDIIIRMDEFSTSQRMCAIAMLENVADRTFSVEKLVNFFDNHPSMDKFYGWGLNWKPGRK